MIKGCYWAMIFVGSNVILEHNKQLEQTSGLEDLIRS